MWGYIRFYNWWPIKTVEDEWFYNFVNHRKISLPSKSINFFSVFGPRDSIREFPKSENEKVVFFTGENVNHHLFGKFKDYVNHCVDEADLSLGFNKIMAENYMRFPLWIRHIYRPEWTYSEFKSYIEQLNSPDFRLNQERKHFVCHISSHDASGVRRYFIDLLEPIDHIACAGNFNHNTDDLHKKYNDNKIEYLKNFKFNLCPENTSTDFYITEKIFEAIMGGCIPIYWGGGNQLAVEPEVLNQEAILRHTGDNERDLFEKIYMLHTSEEAYREFAHIKPFKDDAVDIIWEILDQLEQRLKWINNG